MESSAEATVVGTELKRIEHTSRCSVCGDFITKLTITLTVPKEMIDSGKMTPELSQALKLYVGTFRKCKRCDVYNARLIEL